MGHKRLSLPTPSSEVEVTCVTGAVGHTQEVSMVVSEDPILSDNEDKEEFLALHSKSGQNAVAHTWGL